MLLASIFRDWDDLTHGTAVFGVALPFVAGLFLLLELPERWRWLRGACALVLTFVWCFGLPGILPKSSDDAALACLAGIVFCLIIEQVTPSKWPLSLVLRITVFGWLAWLLYPAWLAQDGGSGRKWLVAGSVATSVAVWSLLCQFSVAKEPGRRRLTMAAFIPSLVSLAVLLQLGGAGRFAQSTAAVTALIAAACCLGLFRKFPVGDARLTAIAGTFFVFFAWCGWLFAEIRYGLAAILLAGPVAAWLFSFLPVSRDTRFRAMLFDFVVAAAAVGWVAWIAISDYLVEIEESGGY